MKKPTTRCKAKTEPTRATKPTAKAKPHTTTPSKEKKPTKSRRRPGVPFNLKILFPKQPELRKAIFSGSGVKEVFRDHIIKAGLFTLQGDEVSIVLSKPLKRKPRGEYCDDAELLLEDLAATLADFFTHQVKTKGYSTWNLVSEITRSVGTITGTRQTFLEAGVPEKSFDVTVKRLKRWMMLVATVKVDRTEKTPLEDLRIMLFLSFKHLSRLSELQIFASVGRLLKYLGFEAGTDKAIANRLKTAINERRKENGIAFPTMDLYLRTFYSTTP
ncbi:MAG: hypothetical protein HY892_06675 [Deltaproteobacteria bacterium]|nr:hypothetical protein [Deltaproteobacteria bacterium]